MVSKFILNLKNYKKGITLVEIVVVIFIIVLFSSILIADFPRIQRQFALSRATYKLAQDLRKIQDLGLSGVQINDHLGEQITTIKGYGIYINLLSRPNQYLLYADIGDTDYQRYGSPIPATKCSEEPESTPQSDCVIDIIDLTLENTNLYIKSIDSTNSIPTDSISINFNPPSPTTHIENDSNNIFSEIGIVLGLHSDPASERTIWINTSGLIRVE